MRVRSRWVLGFCGLAIASTASAQQAQPYAPVPAAAAPSPGGASVINLQHSPEMQAASAAVNPGLAGMPTTMAGPSTGANYAPAPGAAPAVASAPAPAAGHHHHGLLGRRHCVECQRARAKAVDGVEVPPPPGYPGGEAMVAGGTVISGPVVVSERVVGPVDPNAAGFAVVGGPESAPGFAVVNGGMPAAEPTPIGVARSGLNPAADPRMAAAMPRPGAGSYDPAVQTTSVPAPPTPMSGPGHNRPHIISHVLGLPIIGKHHEQRVEKRREAHSAEAYGDANEKVTELPASAVYGRR